MRTISVKMDEKTYNKLFEIEKKMSRTQSDAIRQLIREYKI